MSEGQTIPDYKKAHLNMIQGVINRMAHNSFLLKGWSVTLVSALFALAANQHNPFFATLAILPALAFWGLDGYFLRQERLFRQLYDHVREKDEQAIDFSMKTKAFEDEVDPWQNVTVSQTLLIFHGAIVAAVVVVIIYLLVQCNAQTAKAISSLSTIAWQGGGFC